MSPQDTHSGYASPEVLVSTEWVAEHGHDANVRLIEVDVDTKAYDSGHIAGAVGWNWHTDTQDTLRRNLCRYGIIPKMDRQSPVFNLVVTCMCTHLVRGMLASTGRVRAG